MRPKLNTNNPNINSRQLARKECTGVNFSVRSMGATTTTTTSVERISNSNATQGETTGGTMASQCVESIVWTKAIRLGQ